MKFSTPLVRGRILKRYKRFLADVELDGGGFVTAHVANTGSMKTCWEPGQEVLLSYHDNPKRKLRYSLEMVFNGRTWIGVNTALPNKLAREAIGRGWIGELRGYARLEGEAAVGSSRLDLLLYNDKTKDPCYVEVKNVTLLDGTTAVFPDAVSVRGQKHLQALTDLVRRGTRAVMLYVINREDVGAFAPAAEIDPRYADLLTEAHGAGVEVLAYQCRLTPGEIALKNALPVQLGGR